MLLEDQLNQQVLEECLKHLKILIQKSNFSKKKIKTNKDFLSLEMKKIMIVIHKKLFMKNQKVA